MQILLFIPFSAINEFLERIGSVFIRSDNILQMILTLVGERNQIFVYRAIVTFCYWIHCLTIPICGEH